jgi:hypothetical protein
MTTAAFIRKWLANPEKHYDEHCRNEMLDDLYSVIEQTQPKQKLNVHGVMQPEGSDGAEGAAVGQRSGGTNAEGEELLCFCANGGREGLHGICTNCGNYVGSSREGHL